MLTVGRMARRFGLSRSTLLYYDSIGLLSPSARSPKGYRLYGDDDVARMERISVLRAAGLPLADIARVLEADRGVLAERLEARLRSLNAEIRDLRVRQHRIADLLRSDAALAEGRVLDKERWVAILRATGLDEDGMRRWHEEFERSSPEGHRDFLESLGLPDDEIDRIRRSC